VNTESTSVRVTVNCKVCRSVDSAILPAVPSCVNKESINPIQTPIVTPTCDNINELGTVVT
jgi:hypothetical protein